MRVNWSEQDLEKRTNVDLAGEKGSRANDYLRALDNFTSLYHR